MNARALAASLWLASVGGGCLTPGAHSERAPALASAPGARMVQVRNAWLRVHTEGESGTPVVFVHGYGSRLETWKAVQPLVAARHATLSFDQRGFGKSERPEAGDDDGYGARAHAADLIALLDGLGLERAVLVGHSYGASVVLHAALAAPDRVAGIVLVSPFVLDRQKNSFLRWAEVPLVGEWLYATSYRGFSGEKLLLSFAEPHKYASLAALDEIEQNQALPGTRYAALATVRGMDFDEDRYPALARDHQLPITLVWGDRDRVTPMRKAADVSAALGPSHLVRLPGVGHMPPWERPEAVADAIEELCARVDGATTTTGATP